MSSRLKKKTIKARIAAVAAGKFETYRDIYIYSAEELNDPQVGKIAGVTGMTIYRNRKADREAGIDWHEERRAVQEHVLKAAAEIIEKDTLRDIEGQFVQHQLNSQFISSLIRDEDTEKALKDLRSNDIHEFFKVLNLMARTVKSVADIDDKLAGNRAMQRMFEGQMESLGWFVDLVQSTVKDPIAVRKIADAIEERQRGQTIIAVDAHAEHIAYARGGVAQDGAGVPAAVAKIDRQLPAPPEVEDDDDDDEIELL